MADSGNPAQEFCINSSDEQILLYLVHLRNQDTYSDERVLFCWIRLMDPGTCNVEYVLFLFWIQLRNLCGCGDEQILFLWMENTSITRLHNFRWISSSSVKGLLINSFDQRLLNIFFFFLFTFRTKTNNIITT